MTNENKNILLDRLNATGFIDKIGYIIEGSNLCDGFVTTSWASASSGVLANSTEMDFTNSSGSSINIIGVALFSSSLTAYDGDPLAADSAVKTDLFDSTITLEDGETLRLENYTYTIE
jgi:hypothetical protein